MRSFTARLVGTLAGMARSGRDIWSDLRKDDAVDNDTVAKALGYEMALDATLTTLSQAEIEEAAYLVLKVDGLEKDAQIAAATEKMATWLYQVSETPVITLTGDMTLMAINEEHLAFMGLMKISEDY